MHIKLKIVQTVKFLVLCLIISASTSVKAEILNGRVVGVSDGDTITVLDADKMQYKVRLSGIDAPEKSQPFGKASKKSLSDLIYDKKVTVDWHKNDQYGRTVGKVLINGIDANQWQIKNGMAWFYRKYQNELVLDDRLGYLHAEEAARVNKLGLWSDTEIMAPWDFRKQKRKINQN